MPDPAPFLAAVCASPDDDLPRLVFADWLDEHGDPARAEFIRLQCHTARVGKLDPTWAPAKLREFDLFKANEPAWRTPTASQEGRMLMDRWVRGFPRAVMLSDVARGRVTSGEWANGVYDWTANPNERYDPWPAGPVRDVSFSGWDDECGDLLWHPQLRTVRSLSLTEWYAGVSTRRVETFVTALSLLPPGHFPELTSLDFGGELTLNALETLAESAVVESLTELSLRFPDDVPLSEAHDWYVAARQLFAAIAPRLESLTLEETPDVIVMALYPADWSRLTRFGMSSADSGKVVILTQTHMPKLERLRVWPAYSNSLVWTEANVRQFARWLSAGVLKELTPTGLTTGLLRDLLVRLNTPELASLSVFGECRLSAADLAEHDAFRGLKNLKGPFTNADLAALADPDVLPELHTVWSGDTEPLTGLRWRGGVRTVIPKDPPNGWRDRPSRGSWFG
mgnify:CR=1 FL=1